jgi:small-conductance mechanosensitive channel
MLAAAGPAASAPAAAAQSHDESQIQPKPGRPGAAMDARLDHNEASLKAIRQASRARAFDDAALQAQKAAIGPIAADLADAVSTLTPRLDDAKARLAELGPAPAASEPPEAPDVVEARTRLTKMQTSIEGNLTRARLLSVEASQLDESLARKARRYFSARLWAHSRSLLDPTLWGDVAAKAPADLERARALLTPRPNVQARPPASGPAQVWAAVLAGLGLLVLIPMRILLIRLGRHWSVTRVPNSGLRKSALALWLTLVGALTPLLAGHLLYTAATGVLTLTPAVDALARSLIGVVFYAALIDALGRSLLAPGRSSWRLAPVSDAFVGRVAVFPALIGAAVGVATFLARASGVLDLSLATTEAGRGLGVVLQILAVGGALAWARSATTLEQKPGQQNPSRLPWVLAAVAAWLALVASLLAVVTGYVALASFVMRELIWIGTVLASLFLLMRFVDDLCDALFAPRQPLSRLVGAATGISDLALEQIGVLLSGVLRLGLLVFGWMAIMAPFGASAGDAFARATSTEMVFRLGQIAISPGLIFGAALVFAAGMVVTRIIRGWLETTYLPKTRIDVGLRTSLTAGLTYLGALIAILMTCAYLGLSLSKIALFASALSVGIGFGLQAVIGNFVSGLILLAERPLKVGDRIAIGDQEGDVRRINIRATEIELGDRSKLIVPNSDLVSKVVRNVTHGGALGQVKFVLRVANDADPAEVRKLILDQIAANPGVLRDPPPSVYLTNVTDGALDFTVVAAIASARQSTGVKSDLLFAMVAELKARGVKLAA